MMLSGVIIMALVKRDRDVQQPAIRTGAARGQAARFPYISLLLGALAFAGILISIWMIFLYAPMDAVQGEPQRIFYFHVPMAWLGMLGFGVVAAGGIGYLITKDERWDWAARASAELGALFITLALVTGSRRGKPT